jgi:hypothetical protein
LTLSHFVVIIIFNKMIWRNYNEKLSKYISVVLFSTTLLNITAPVVTETVDAATIHTVFEKSKQSSISQDEPVENRLAAEDVDAVVEVLKSEYPDLSEDYLREIVNNQRHGNYSLPSESQPSSTRARSAMFSKSNWKGITVSQMGAAIDAAIIGASGGAASLGVKFAIKKIGKKAAKKVIVKAIQAIVGGAAGKVTSTVVGKALDYAGSPGYYIAKYWDAHDKYPKNVRINF